MKWSPTVVFLGVGHGNLDTSRKAAGSSGHVNVCSCQNLTVTRTSKNSTHAKSSVPFTCQWPILHFHSWIKKIQQNLKAFTGRDPCNNWTMGLQRKWHSSFGKFRINFSNWRRRKPRHSVQNVFACVHYSQYRERILGRIRSRAQKVSLYWNLRRFSRMR